MKADREPLPAPGFWPRLARWQRGRALWLGLAGTAIFLELFSWAYFQRHLRLMPCELCVYIRFSMLVIALGALTAALGPRRLGLRLAGGLIILWGLARGLIWNIRLELENLRAADPDWISVCRPAEVSYPGGLALDKWLPEHFQPQALCGHDSALDFFGLNMAEWLFFFYGALGLGLLALLAAELKARKSAA